MRSVKDLSCPKISLTKIIPRRKTVKDQNISLLWGRDIKHFLHVTIPHFFKEHLQDFLFFGQLQGLLLHKNVVTPVASAKTSSASVHPAFQFLIFSYLSFWVSRFLGLCTVLKTSQVFSHISKTSTCYLDIFKIFINWSGSLEHLSLGFLHSGNV